MSQELNRVFISYRRDDSRWFARALKNKLTNAIGEDRVFMDVDSIDPGVDFVDVIDDMVAKVDVMIAILGPEFLTATHADGTRLIDDPANWVRLEIATALRRKIRVIPLLQQGAELPKVGDLPDDLKPLARRNAIHIGELTFEADVDRIIASLQRFWERGSVEGDTNVPPPAHVARSPKETSPSENSSAPTPATNAAAPKASTPATDAGRPAWLVPFLVIGGIAALFAVLWYSGVFSRPDDGSTAGKMPNSSPSSTDNGDGTRSSNGGDAGKENKDSSKPKDPSTGDNKEKKHNDESADSKKTESPGAEKSGDGDSTGDSTGTKEPTTGNNDDKQASKENVVAAIPGKDAAPAQVEGMVWIEPAGEISEGFYIGQYEVTQQQYEFVMGNNPAQNKSPMAPVTNVTWDDARKFCAKLNSLNALPPALGIADGFEFKLPTKAQWQFAGSNSGKKKTYTDEDLDAVAYCQSNLRGTGTFRQKPTTVGSKDPVNGVYDMLGNVAEWCRENEEDDGPYGGYKNKDLLGGSYFSKTADCQPTSFQNQRQDTSADRFGFRIVAVKK